MDLAVFLSIHFSHLFAVTEFFDINSMTCIREIECICLPVNTFSNPFIETLTKISTD